MGKRARMVEQAPPDAPAPGRLQSGPIPQDPEEVSRAEEVFRLRCMEAGFVDALTETRAALSELGEPPQGEVRAEAPGLLDVRAAASLAGVHPNTVYGGAAAGELRCTRIGRLLRFRREDVLDWGQR